MKFRVVLEVVFNDNSADKVGIYTYDSEDLALQGFYKYMSQYVGVENVDTVNVLAKNNVGGIYKNEFWVNPIKPTPTVEEVVEEESEEEVSE